MYVRMYSNLTKKLINSSEFNLNHKPKSYKLDSR